MHDMLSTFHQYRYHLLAFLLLVILHSMIPLHAEDALPSEATKLIAKCDEDITKSRKALLGALAKVKDKATKSGNLEAANAVNTKMAEIAKLTGDDAPLLGDANEAPKHTSKFVIMYPLPDYKGNPVIVKTIDAITDAVAAGVANDSLRSIKVPEGYKVTLFESENGGGASRTVDCDTPSIGNIGGSGMSSFIIQRAK